MYYKIRIVFILVLNVFFISQCSILEKIVYRQEIYQGNYFTLSDIKKLYIGMHKTQVADIFGVPVLNSVFENNIWHYILYKKTGVYNIEEKILTLFFSKKNTLVNFQYKKI